MFCVINVTVALRPHLKEHQPMTKLVAFKLIVTLTFVQQIIFRILDGTHKLEPTNTLTWADLHVGIPCMLSCIEMVPICLLMVYSYPLTPYIHQRDTQAVEAGIAGQDIFARSYQGGPFGVWAWLAMLDPRETIEGFMFAFRIGGENKQVRKMASPAEYNPIVELGEI